MPTRRRLSKFASPLGAFASIRAVTRLGLLGALATAACTNDPYPDSDRAQRVLYLPFTEAPKTLDPAIAYDTASHEITANVDDTLLEYHYLERPYRLIPGLSQNVPEGEPQADGSVRYRFALRDDLWFQDDPCFGAMGRGEREGKGVGETSRRVTSADFVFELMRIGDPAVNSPVVEPFANVRGFAAFGDRLRARRKSDPAFKKLSARTQYATVGGIEGARAEDGALVVVLDHPYPQILYWFAMPFTTPVPWEAVDYYDGNGGRPHFADHPVGSGPFRLVRYEKESRMVLERNPRWYGQRHPEWKAPGAVYPDMGDESDPAGAPNPDYVGKPLPFLERIELRREKERIPAFNKFLQGYYDASGVIRESFDKVVKGDHLSPDMEALGVQLDKSVTAGVYYIGFNMDDAVVGSKGGESAKKLRQALSLATDSTEYCRVFLNARGVAAQSVIPPGIFGYEPGYKNPYRTVDFERAKQLLAEAGYPGGVDPKTKLPLHLTFDVNDTSADGRLRFQFWTQNWRRIGVDVEVASSSYNKFQEKIHDGAYQIFQWGWIADYPDAENFLFLLWSQMGASKDNGPNTANFSDPRFDELFLQIKSLPDGPAKLELVRRARAILEEQRPWIELYHPEDYLLFHGWLSNVKSSGLSNPTLKYYDVSPEKRSLAQRTWNRPILWPGFALALMLSIAIVPGIRTYLKERR
ncbi:MAG TPA: ABC transporter substrate-binding protein [Polyangiaceae bacterium]|nr:ABC transporter substrate-binding protein [Polyangiaceae bacterium]